MNLAFLAEQSLQAANTVARLTPIAWVVEVHYLRPDGSHGMELIVAESPLAARPDTDELVPKDCELQRAVAFPAMRFDEMAEDQRQRYSSHYKEFQIFRRCKALGMKREDYLASQHHDPVALDEQRSRWVRPGRYLGD